MVRGLVLMACLFFVGPLAQVAVAVVHDVGGSFGWNLPPSPTFFSEWASNQTFFVDDELVFKSKVEETHNYALPSSQADFDGCNNPGVVFLPDISTILTRPGRYYFICAVGNHCKVGMKFAIDVFTRPGAPSSASSSTIGALVAFLSTVATVVLA